MNTRCRGTAEGLITLFVGSLVTSRTFGTAVLLTITVIINVVFEPGLKRTERRLKDYVHNVNLLNGVDVECAIGGVGKQRFNSDGAEIIESIAPQRNANRHSSRR